MSELSEYLLSRQEKSAGNKTNFFQKLSGDNVKKWFGNSEKASAVIREDDVNGNEWFSNDPLLPSLSKKQRIVGFLMLLILGIFCFTLAGLYFPVLLIKTRKFALLYTLGSVFFLASFSLLWGPLAHVKHLCSRDRMLFTSAYFSTLILTLYFALWVKSTFLTGFFAICQVLTLIWYIVSYIPGGQKGLWFFTKLFTSAATKTASKTLPV